MEIYIYIYIYGSLEGQTLTGWRGMGKDDEIKFTFKKIPRTLTMQVLSTEKDPGRVGRWMRLGRVMIVKKGG